MSSDEAAVAGGSSLVVWGSTGRRLHISRQDLAMPARIKELPNAPFYEKQWEAVSGFWLNRVLKEAALQHMQVSDVVKLIEKDIEERWQARRREHAIHKKKKRLLASKTGSPAGAPSDTILITNVCSLDEYESCGTDDSRRELLAAITNRVEAVSKGSVLAVQVLVDTSGSDQGVSPVTKDEDSGPSPAKKARLDGEADASRDASEKTAVPAPAPPAPFDDRVAVVCRLDSKDRAALAIAHLHGSLFDGRTVVCRFWSA